MKTLYWTLVGLMLAFGVTTVVLVTLSLTKYHYDYPSRVDVVIQERGAQRHEYQVMAVSRYMKWVRKVYVFHPIYATGTTKSIGNYTVTYIQLKSNFREAAFHAIPSIPGIHAHFLFLSDMTFPMRPVKLSYLFYRSDPRMFNVLRASAVAHYLEVYLEDDLTPVLVGEIENLKRTDKTLDFVFRSMTEDQVTLRHDLNMDVMLRRGTEPNASLQLAKVKERSPLFATFHVTNESGQSVKDVERELLDTFLQEQFTLS